MAISWFSRGRRPPALDDADPHSGDALLMQRVAAGDRAAFETLMDRHLSTAVRLAGRIVWTAEDAHDLAQDVFIRVWSRAEQFDPGKAAFRTWLYRLVVNTAIDWRRRSRHHLPLDAADAVPDGRPGQEDVVEGVQLRDRLRRSVASLPERQAAALGLFYFDQLSGDEAAEIMGMKRGAFDTLLHRARKALRQEMDAGVEE